ncbi:unnamed protein product [Phytomonas sp. EM1]|nr:unnamed protein product [Phytomonas sp. EM1]|eukprot:CCW64627.1 unnamed protein product [Phytomonas sp. isolate EM1]
MVKKSVNVPKSSRSMFPKGDPSTCHIVSCVRSVLGGALTLVGTNRGVALGYYHPQDGDASQSGTLIFMQKLHHGPVYSFTSNTSNLIASTGHDGACCVITLASIFSKQPMIPPSRFTGHTLPVVAAVFFSDDRTLASLSINGLVLLHDVFHGARNGGALVGFLRVGFPARCLALSRDETCCYVAGRRLVQVDLFNGLRPSRATGFEFGDANGSPDNHRPWLSFYSWTNSKGVIVNTTAADEYFQNLDVCQEDGAVLGTIANRSIDVMKSRERSDESTGFVRWSIAPGRFAASIGIYSPIAKARTGLSHKEAPFCVGTHLDLDHELKGSLPSLWEVWSAKDLRTSQCNIPNQPWKSYPRFSNVRWSDLCLVASEATGSISSSPALFGVDHESCLTVERVKNKLLQQECNELFAELKSLTKREKDSDPERLIKKPRLNS